MTSAGAAGLRVAVPTDSAVMAAIHARAFPAHDAWSADVFALQLALPNVIGLLHEAGGLILTRVAADESEILTLAVVPEARRRGVAGQLILQATIRLRAQGARTLFLEVSDKNIAARQLYTETGFVAAGVRRNYYSDRSDAMVLRLDLDRPDGGAAAARSGAAPDQ